MFYAMLRNVTAVAAEKGFWDSLPGWVGALGALFGIIVLVASAAAVIWSTAAQKQTKALEGTNVTLMQRVEILERENIEVKAQREALQERVHVLEDVVTSKKELQQLQDSLNAHDHRVDLINQNIINQHAEVMEALHTNKTEIERIFRQGANTRQLLNKLGTVGKIVRPDVDAVPERPAPPERESDQSVGGE